MSKDVAFFILKYYLSRLIFYMDYDKIFLVMKMKTVCFTGRRPQKLPWGYNELDERCIELKRKLDEKINWAISSGATHFISGMALGVDMWAAEIVLEKKKAGCPITLEAAIPHKHQPAKWSLMNKTRYNNILKECDNVTVISEKYTYSCMMQRNCYMVDKSDCVIAVLDDYSGGTGKTVLYARSKGLDIEIINI